MSKYTISGAEGSIKKFVVEQFSTGPGDTPWTFGEESYSNNEFEWGSTALGLPRMSREMFEIATERYGLTVRRLGSTWTILHADYFGPAKAAEIDREAFNETLGDIAFNAGYFRFRTLDSRTLPGLFVKWAEEFETRYAGVEWGEALDYIETVDDFTLDKIREAETSGIGRREKSLPEGKIVLDNANGIC